MKHRHPLSLLPRGEREAWHESINTIYTPFPPFVHPHLLHWRCGTEWMFVSVKMGSQGERDADAGLAL